MKWYDLVRNPELKEEALSLGFDKVFSFEEVNAFEGGSLEKNRKIVRKKKALLVDPVVKGKEFDSAVAQVAKDNNVTIVFTLKRLLEAHGYERARLLRAEISAIQLCLKKKVNFIICSGAEDEYDLRQPLILSRVGLVFGLTLPKSKWVVGKAYEAGDVV